MVVRQALLAALLVSGTAAVAAAQSDEFPFRRFGSRHFVMPRFDVRMRPFRFDSRNTERVREQAERARDRAERIRERLQERNHDLAERIRERTFSRNRMDFQFRDMDRLRDRLRNRMDHFRFDRPMIMRRHSRTI